MKLTDLFIRRPVLAIVVNLVIVIAGVQAIRGINVRQYPRSENAAITITTAYVGANAALVRGFVTTPLERVIAAADGVDYLESESAQNLSTIRAHLRLNYDATRALAEIGSKVDQVRRDLPPEAEIPILNVESVDSQFASAYLSFSSELLQQNEITDYLVRVVQPRLSSIEGVQRADILGARTFAMRIWLRPDRMASLNVSPAQVRQALANNNYLSAVGQTKGSLVQVNLTANTDLRSVREFQQLVVREQGGAVSEPPTRVLGTKLSYGQSRSSCAPIRLVGRGTSIRQQLLSHLGIFSPGIATATVRVSGGRRSIAPSTLRGVPPDRVPPSPQPSAEQRLSQTGNRLLDPHHVQGPEMNRWRSSENQDSDTDPTRQVRACRVHEGRFGRRHGNEPSPSYLGNATPACVRLEQTRPTRNDRRSSHLLPGIENEIP